MDSYSKRLHQLSTSLYHPSTLTILFKKEKFSSLPPTPSNIVLCKEELERWELFGLQEGGITPVLTALTPRTLRVRQNSDCPMYFPAVRLLCSTSSNPTHNLTTSKSVSTVVYNSCAICGYEFPILPQAWTSSEEVSPESHHKYELHIIQCTTPCWRSWAPHSAEFKSCNTCPFGHTSGIVKGSFCTFEVWGGTLVRGITPVNPQKAYKSTAESSCFLALAWNTCIIPGHLSHLTCALKNNKVKPLGIRNVSIRPDRHGETPPTAHSAPNPAHVHLSESSHISHKYAAASETHTSLNKWDQMRRIRGY